MTTRDLYPIYEPKHRLLIALCFWTPGLTLFASLFLLSQLLPSLGLSEYANKISFAITMITAIGCGIFSSLIKLSIEDGRETPRPRRVSIRTIEFLLAQILIAPTIAFIGMLAFFVHYLSQ